ncbi:MAG: hypothetical protein HY876_00380 [Coriobacteriales bacterium]|nr:hypothetical protein [Coriobacteriales bacterium]
MNTLAGMKRIAKIVALTVAFALLLGAVPGCASIKGCASSARKSIAGETTGTVVLDEDEIERRLTPPPAAGKVEPPPKGAYLGVYVPPAPFTIRMIDQFEDRAGRSASIVMWYQPWSKANRWRFDSAACVAVMRRGKVPMITWEPWNPGTNSNKLRDPANQPSFRLQRISEGKFDAYIRSWARQCRDLGGPIMLRPMHEMNGTWYPWSGTVNGNTPKEYVRAWRHMHRIFEQEGATNVTWVWSINHESVPGTRENRYAAYYPGDEYVDWTAISGFNWGESSPYSSWRSYWYWYEEPLTYLKKLDKPICIAEFACVEQGGDKAAWLADAYKRIKKDSDIKAVIYFNSRETGGIGTQDWRIESSQRSVKAFRKAVASDYFVSTPPAALSDWAESLSPQDWVYLTSFNPVY